MNGVGASRGSANRKSGLHAGGCVYDVEGVSLLFQFRRYRLPLRAPVRTAHGLWSERDGVLVRLADEAGAAGYGEAAVIPWFGTETADQAEEVCRAIAGGADGGQVNDERLANVPAKLGCLRNAIAMAREDLAKHVVAKEPGRECSAGEEGEAPVKLVVGGAEAQKLYRAVAALLPAGRTALEVVRARAEMGFRVFKWKVGVADLADELSLLDDVCALLPSGSKLRLDANGAWDRRKAERWLERCAERPVEFVEQPIAREARGAEDLLMGLAGDWPTPIALDESIVGEGDLERWLGNGWPGVLVVKPSLLGDVDAALKRLEKAKAAVVFSSALETAVGAKAALRVAFRWTGEARALGFGVWPLFADGRFDGPTAMPFMRWDDVQRLDAEAVWNALS
jgi:O-succinylbenzoate synthase